MPIKSSTWPTKIAIFVLLVGIVCLLVALHYNDTEQNRQLRVNHNAILQAVKETHETAEKVKQWADKASEDHNKKYQLSVRMEEQLDKILELLDKESKWKH